MESWFALNLPKLSETCIRTFAGGCVGFIMAFCTTWSLSGTSPVRKTVAAATKDARQILELVLFRGFASAFALERIVTIYGVGAYLLGFMIIGGPWFLRQRAQRDFFIQHGRVLRKFVTNPEKIDHDDPGTQAVVTQFLKMLGDSPEDD